MLCGSPCQPYLNVPRREAPSRSPVARPHRVVFPIDKMMSCSRNRHNCRGDAMDFIEDIVAVVLQAWFRGIGSHQLPVQEGLRRGPMGLGMIDGLEMPRARQRLVDCGTEEPAFDILASRGYTRSITLFFHCLRESPTSLCTLLTRFLVFHESTL